MESQQNYAQIEKEMLALVFGCERFHGFLYGQNVVTVESDHEPLEAILKKPSHQAPLQKMILWIKPYAVNVKYVPGSSQFEIHVLHSGNFWEPMLQKLKNETQKDPELQQLKMVVMHGWPQIKDKTPTETRRYWNYRDKICCYEGLKCSRVIEQ